jgi:hypothetical protein
LENTAQNGVASMKMVDNPVDVIRARFHSHIPKPKISAKKYLATIHLWHA